MIEGIPLVTLDRKMQDIITAMARGIGEKVPVLYFRQKPPRPPRFLDNDGNVVFGNPNTNGGGGNNNGNNNQNPVVDNDRNNVFPNPDTNSGGGDNSDNTDQTQRAEVELEWISHPPQEIIVNSPVEWRFRLNSPQQAEYECLPIYCKWLENENDWFPGYLFSFRVQTNTEATYTYAIRATGA